jgi:trigger factor
MENNTAQKMVEIENIEIKYPILDIKEPEYCKLKITYEGDPAIVEQKRDEAVASVRHLPVPGYRPGKAPDSAIKVKLKKHIDNFVAREMAAHAVDDVVFEANIKPIGIPTFSKVDIRNNKFVCEFEMWKKPAITLNKYKGFEIPKPHVKIDADAFAEKSLQDLRIRFGEVEPYGEGDVVAQGDIVTFSFSATIDGETFEGSSVEGEMYTVGQNRWKGFDDYLIGMKSEETREFSFVFENDVPVIGGKTAQFKVTLHMGTKRKPHPIDEEFLKQVGVNTLDELKLKLSTVSKSIVDQQAKSDIRQQASVRLLQENTFEIPDFLVKAEAEHMGGGAMAFSLLSDDEKNKLMIKAKDSVHLSLVLDSVREVEPDACINAQEARNYLKSNIQAQGQDPSWVDNPQASNIVANLIGSVTNEFTLQWICDQSKIIE